MADDKSLTWEPIDPRINKKISKETTQLLCKLWKNLADEGKIIIQDYLHSKYTVQLRTLYVTADSPKVVAEIGQLLIDFSLHNKITITYD